MIDAVPIVVQMDNNVGGLRKLGGTVAWILTFQL